jgi:transposase
VRELADRDVKVDARTVWSFAHREGFSFKKNRARQRAKAS